MSESQQRPDADALSLFPAEPVPPPAATEIDALIDAVSVGERLPHQSQSTVPRTVTRATTSGLRHQLATMLLLRPAVLRWVLPSVLAFSIGSITVFVGLRMLQPMVPSESRKLTEPVVAPKHVAPPRPVATTAVSSPVELVPGPPVVIGLPTATIQRPGKIVVKPPTFTPPRNEGRVAVAPTRALPRPPAPVATSGSTGRTAATDTGQTLAVPATLSPIAVPGRSPADIVALAPPPIAPAFSGGMATAPRLAPVVAEENAVRAALRDYEGAVEDLDVVATAEVWPSVDRRALSRAFATLKSQGLEFDSCDVSVATTMATARCSGTLEVVRKVGSASPMILQQHWLFKMRKYGSEWKIQEVTASQTSSFAAQRDRGGF